MGLKSVIANAVKSGLTALDDVKVSATYNSRTIGNYDPSTGTNTNTTTSYTLTGVFYNARDREVDGIKVLIDDKRFLFAQADLSITPKHKDTVVINSITYNVVNIIPDPANATWTLFLRA